MAGTPPSACQISSCTASRPCGPPGGRTAATARPAAHRTPCPSGTPGTRSSSPSPRTSEALSPTVTHAIRTPLALVGCHQSRATSRAQVLGRGYAPPVSADLLVLFCLTFFWSFFVFLSWWIVLVLLLRELVLHARLQWVVFPPGLWLAMVPDGRQEWTDTEREISGGMQIVEPVRCENLCDRVYKPPLKFGNPPTRCDGGT